MFYSLFQLHASFSTVCHEDNHSQTSAETTTSDSGRGGSESDLHSTSLSHSHDSGKLMPFNHANLIHTGTFDMIVLEAIKRIRGN